MQINFRQRKGNQLERIDNTDYPEDDEEVQLLAAIRKTLDVETIHSREEFEKGADDIAYVTTSDSGT